MEVSFKEDDINMPNNNEQNKDTQKEQTKPELPRHDVTSRVSEIFELISTRDDKNNISGTRDVTSCLGRGGLLFEFI